MKFLVILAMLGASIVAAQGPQGPENLILAATNSLGAGSKDLKFVRCHGYRDVGAAVLMRVPPSLSLTYLRLSVISKVSRGLNGLELANAQLQEAFDLFTKPSPCTTIAAEFANVRPSAGTVTI
jgi:hypothetical protein